MLKTITASQNKITLDISSVNDLPEVAQQLLAFCENRKALAFIGEIGAGKTTLITQLCEILQVEDIVSSPTFSIINEYKGLAHDVFHIDLYRLETIEEALNIGIEDYLYSQNYCFVEWAALIASLLDEKNLVTVKIEILDNNHRQITFLKGEMAIDFD